MKKTFLKFYMSVPFLLVMLFAGSGLAEVKSFSVLPFNIMGPPEYAYLGKAIPSMLNTRLTWPGHFEPATAEEAHEAVVPAGEQDAQSLRQKLGVDALVYGAVTIVGKKCSLDVHVAQNEKTLFPVSKQTTIDNLIPSLEVVADRINDEVFGRKEPVLSAPAAEKINQMNPAFIFNETSAGKEVVMNPGFKYENERDDINEWRSRTMPFVAVGCDIADVDGDGQVELMALTKDKIMAFHIDNKQLLPAGEYQAPKRGQCLNINLIDLNRDGLQEIVVSALLGKDPNSFILNYQDGKFIEVQKNMNLHLNVVRTPPNYSRILVGERKGNGRLFGGGVREIVKMSGSYRQGSKISLPKKGNVYNFAFLPEGESYKTILATKLTRLSVYSAKDSQLAETEATYCGTGNGIEIDQSVVGMEPRKDYDPDLYYIPSSIIPADLDRDGNYELIVNKSISVSAQFFSRYRAYPQGEIHSLYWDGIGLNTQWKTRRIKGSVIDYRLGDVDQDESLDMVVCVNTHPGMTGLKHVKTVFMFYRLNVKKSAD